MRALEFSPANGFTLVDGGSVALGPDEVRLRVDACGVCGSDRQVVQGESIPGGTAFPVVLGHEIAGTVVERGRDAVAWTIGQAVVVYPFIACGTCVACRHDQPNLCLRQICVGYQRPGGFAEEVVVPVGQLLARPSHCPAAAAALLVDAYATPYHGLKLAATTPDQTLLVMGTGGLGLAALQLAKASGSTQVCAVSRRTDGVAVALDYGAHHAIALDDDARSAARQLRRWSGASGIDVVLDTVATAATISLAMEVVRPGGVVVLLGMPEGDATFPVAKTVRRGVRLLGSYGSTKADVQDLLTLVAGGRLDPSRLIAGTLTLLEADRAFADVRSPGRWVLTPNPPG